MRRLLVFNASNVIIQDIVAEWLRRWIANPLLFERVSSNLIDVVFTFWTSQEPLVGSHGRTPTLGSPW